MRATGVGTRGGAANGFAVGADRANGFFPPIGIGVGARPSGVTPEVGSTGAGALGPGIALDDGKPGANGDGGGANGDGGGANGDDGMPGIGGNATTAGGGEGSRGGAAENGLPELGVTAGRAKSDAAGAWMAAPVTGRGAAVAADVVWVAGRGGEVGAAATATAAAPPSGQV